MPITDLLRPLIKRLLVAHVRFLVRDGRRTRAKQQIVWGHSEGYLDENETAQLMRTHSLADA